MRENIVGITKFSIMNKILQVRNKGGKSNLENAAMFVYFLDGNSGMINVMGIFMAEKIMDELPGRQDG